MGWKGREWLGRRGNQGLKERKLLQVTLSARSLYTRFMDCASIQSLETILLNREIYKVYIAVRR